ncbi:MAG: hypothetical protein IT377_29040 [Polyangiaceae bacterium]|nr:hypothetical protein [Polyangiaceae bacterium]
MRTTQIVIAFATLVGTAACGVDTEPPAVGDVGDNSGQSLKVACNLSRETILSGTAGGRKAAIERGFTWYDAQVPYSQSSQHEGYRTDCSGFVSMCWELGTSYTTADFIADSGSWSSLGSFDDLAPADAMVYRKNGAGHIMMFLGWNDVGKTEACVLEQASTADDMQFRARTVDSLISGGYHAIRASKLGGSSGGTGQQCYCDAQCVQNGDCCADCGGAGQNGSGGAGQNGSGGAGQNGSGGSSGSGSGGSGGAGQCYCDAQCQSYGDCCADCGGSGSGGSGGGGGSGGSGAGGSGGGACYCDAQCEYYGDCCADCP